MDAGRRLCGDRRRHQRHHRPGAARRPGADRDADRIHGDAARLRRRHYPRHRFRRRTPRAGAHRRRRSDLGLGRLRRQGLHQPGNRTAARPQARHAGRTGGGLARGAASARSRPLPRLARQRRGAAARPPQSNFPAARGRRPLPVVLAQGTAGGRLRRRSGAPGRHAHRRDRFQEGRGAIAVRRGARQSHRPAQPRTVHRPHGGGLRLRPLRQPIPAVGAGDRSRPFQAGQRFGRHRGRRFRPAHHRAPARPSAQAAGHAGAAIRRPVRLDPAVGTRARAHRGLRRNAAPHLARADRLQRPRNLHHRLDRAGARRRPVAQHRGSAQGCRARHVSRQADRRRPHRNLQAGHALAQDRPADHGIGIAPRHRARRDQGALPADRAAGGSRHCRLRGAGALGSSQAWPPVAGRVHHHRRGNRPDRRPRPVRARTHRAPTRNLAGRQPRARADLRQRQRVVAAIAAPRPDPGPARRAVALDAGARHLQAGNHRIAGDGKSRARRADAHAHQGARRRAIARRFWHRTFLARLSAALPVRHHQDRPVVRAHHRARHAAGDPALDHRACARSRHGSGGGRRRD